MTDFNLAGEAMSWRPYNEYASVVARLSPAQQAQLKQVTDGPIATGFSLKSEFDRPMQPRRLWFETVRTKMQRH